MKKIRYWQMSSSYILYEAYNHVSFIDFESKQNTYSAMSKRKTVVQCVLNIFCEYEKKKHNTYIGIELYTYNN